MYHFPTHTLLVMLFIGEIVLFALFFIYAVRIEYLVKQVLKQLK